MPTVAGIEVTARQEGKNIVVETVNDPKNSPLLLELLTASLGKDHTSTSVTTGSQKLTLKPQSALMGMRETKNITLDNVNAQLAILAKENNTPSDMRNHLEQAKLRGTVDPGQFIPYAVIGGIGLTIREEGNYIWVEAPTTPENKDTIRKDAADVLQLVSQDLMAKRYTSELKLRSNQVLTIKTAPEGINPTMNQVIGHLHELGTQFKTMEAIRERQVQLAALRSASANEASATMEAAAATDKTDHALEQAKRDMKPYADAAAKSFMESTNVLLPPEKEAKLLEDLAKTHLIQKQRG